MPPKASKETPPTEAMTSRLNLLQSDFSSSAVEDWKTLGNDCFSHGSYLTAIKCYTKGLERNQNNTDRTACVLLSNRSASYLKSSMLSGPAMALKDAEAAAKADPAWFKAHLRVGDAQFHRKKFAEAKAAYEMALQCDPHNEAAKGSLKATEKELFLKSLDDKEKEEKKKAREEGRDASIDNAKDTPQEEIKIQPMFSDQQLEGRKATEDETARLITKWSHDTTVVDNRTAMKARPVSLDEADRTAGVDYKAKLMGNFRQKLATNNDAKRVVEEKTASVQLRGEGVDYREADKYRKTYGRSTDGVGLAITTDAYKDHIGTAKHW